MTRTRTVRAAAASGGGAQPAIGPTITGELNSRG
jgi:hypothetical protein